MNINSTGIIGISALASIGIKATGTIDIHATGLLGIGTTGILSMDGTLVNIGNATAAVTGGLATISIAASIAPQLLQKATGVLPNVSVTELAAVVKPPVITNPLFPTLSRLIKRLKPVLTSIMGSGDNLD